MMYYEYTHAEWTVSLFVRIYRSLAGFDAGGGLLTFLALRPADYLSMEGDTTFGGSLLESLLTVDIANDNVISFFGPDLRPKLFLTTPNCF